MTDDIVTLMRVVQFTDSAFPVGSFSFSAGLETAAETGLVHDATTLSEYVHDVVRASALCDGVAAIAAYRSFMEGDYEALCEADREVLLFKVSSEARTQTLRMGRKFAELAVRTTGAPVVRRWQADIAAERVAGTYPVTGAVVFAENGISERDMFCSQMYGAAGIVLNAALRAVRVSHYDTQRILYGLASTVSELYDRAMSSSLIDMTSFTPRLDILASMHERGTKRLFMN